VFEKFRKIATFFLQIGTFSDAVGIHASQEAKQAPRGHLKPSKL
jgi:hypothetical protein